MLLLLACTGDEDSKNVFDTVDTGTPECGKVRGANAILMYDAADVNTVYYPDTEPDDEVTTGLAGPTSDPYTFLAVQDGDVFRTEDAGCNWSEIGSLPGGDWALLVAEGLAYAFERATGEAAQSDDGGGSWTPFDPGGAFVGTPVASVTDPTWLRGLQADGVATGTNGAWTISAAAPEGTPVDAAFYEGDLDVGIVSTSLGVFTTVTGGLSWENRTEALDVEIGDMIAAHHVAVSPLIPGVMAAVIEGADGVFTLLRTADGGASWQRLADSDGIGLDAASPVWIDPAADTQVITAWTDPGAEFPLHLNVSVPGKGTRIVKTAAFEHLAQLAFSSGEEARWIAAVRVGG